MANSLGANVSHKHNSAIGNLLFFRLCNLSIFFDMSFFSLRFLEVTQGKFSGIECFS